MWRLGARPAYTEVALRAVEVRPIEKAIQRRQDRVGRRRGVRVDAGTGTGAGAGAGVVLGSDGWSLRRARREPNVTMTMMRAHSNARAR